MDQLRQGTESLITRLLKYSYCATCFHAKVVSSLSRGKWEECEAKALSKATHR